MVASFAQEPGEEGTEEPDQEKGTSKHQSPLRTLAHRDEGHPGN